MTKKVASEKQSRSCKISMVDLRKIKPVTINQSKFFNAFSESDFFILSGYPGTGKSFIALYKAIEAVLAGEYERVVIIRSATPTRDLGALPGDLEEKMQSYETPYIQICEKLFGRPDAYSRLKEQRMIKFVSTSYLRSLTFDESVIILDEYQNCTSEELNTVATRVGEQSSLIMCGDEFQIDIKGWNNQSGYHEFMRVIQYMPDTVRIIFDKVEDICRSGFVKDFILAKIKDAQNVSK